jgi:hypothetical protein
MGNEGASGHRVGAAGTDGPDESDLAHQAQGNNQLQGNDQTQVRNQRGTMAMETDRTEGVVESFERMDPKRRA